MFQSVLQRRPLPGKRYSVPNIMMMMMMMMMIDNNNNNNNNRHNYLLFVQGGSNMTGTDHILFTYK
jgi:hypothetical protein